MSRKIVNLTFFIIDSALTLDNIEYNLAFSTVKNFALRLTSLTYFLNFKVLNKVLTKSLNWKYLCHTYVIYFKPKVLDHKQWLRVLLEIKFHHWQTVWRENETSISNHTLNYFLLKKIPRNLLGWRPDLRHFDSCWSRTRPS